MGSASVSAMVSATLRATAGAMVSAAVCATVCAMVSAIKDREGSPPPLLCNYYPGAHSALKIQRDSLVLFDLLAHTTYFPEARFSGRRRQFKHQNGRTRHPIWQDMFELLPVLHLSDQDCELAVKLFAKSQTVIFSNHWNSNSINLDSVVVQQFPFWSNWVEQTFLFALYLLRSPPRFLILVTFDNLEYNCNCIVPQIALKDIK